MSTQTIFSIEEKIKQQKASIAQLEKELEIAKLESPDRQLAKELHGMLCKWNHTDGCGWFYEMKGKQDDWSRPTHEEYLKKAQRLIHRCEQEGCSVNTAISLFKLVAEN